MTMMTMDADDDDEGWGWRRLPVHALRSGYVVPSVKRGQSSAVGPAGPPREPSQNSSGQGRTGLELRKTQVSKLELTVGDGLRLARRESRRLRRTQYTVPVFDANRALTKETPESSRRPYVIGQPVNYSIKHRMHVSSSVGLLLE